MAEDYPHSIIMFEKAFDAYDQDNNGSLSREELQKVFESMGIQMDGKRMGKIWKESDLDQDGKMSKKEFLRVTKHNVMEVMQMWQEVFKKKDVDKDGYISVAELKKISEERGQGEIFKKYVDRFMRDTDKDKNELIDLKEFMEGIQADSWYMFLE